MFPTIRLLLFPTSNLLLFLAKSRMVRRHKHTESLSPRVGGDRIHQFSSNRNPAPDFTVSHEVNAI